MKEVKISPFTGDMTFHMEDLKNFTIRFLDLMNKFSKVVGRKINTQKSITLIQP